ncbi:LxmA leader domain family RiPP [Nonomuraea roseola]|uniref:LxmA leader domain family RiPP n=1 Tax=Nonomuraea roseola TaxID=46179 RepID=A0ABV5QBE0_9ACTN
MPASLRRWTEVATQVVTGLSLNPKLPNQTNLYSVGALTTPPQKGPDDRLGKDEEMRKNDATMELVAGYNAYTGAEDLSVSATGDAPASTPVCVIISIGGIISGTITRMPE